MVQFQHLLVCTRLHADACQPIFRAHSGTSAKMHTMHLLCMCVNFKELWKERLSVASAAVCVHAYNWAWVCLETLLGSQFPVYHHEKTECVLFQQESFVACHNLWPLSTWISAFMFFNMCKKSLFAFHPHTLGDSKALEWTSLCNPSYIRHKFKVRLECPPSVFSHSEMMTDQCGHPYIHIQTDLCCKYWSYVGMPKLKYSMTLLVTFGNHSTHCWSPRSISIGTTLF